MKTLTNLIDKVKDWLHEEDEEFESLDYIDENGESVITGAACVVEFYAKHRENHGFGYHVHLHKGVNNVYTGYLATIKNGEIYLVPHRNGRGKSAKVSTIKIINATEKFLGSYIRQELKGIPEEEMLEPNGNAIKVKAA